MVDLKHVGKIALTLGLKATGRLLGASEAAELKAPAGRAKLDPTSATYAMDIFGLLKHSPLDPHLFESLLNDGYCAACPATAALLTTDCLTELVWPPSFDALRDELAMFGFLKETLMVSGNESDPQRQMMVNFGQMIIDYHRSEGFSASNLPRPNVLADLHDAKLELVRQKPGQPVLERDPEGLMHGARLADIESAIIAKRFNVPLDPNPLPFFQLCWAFRSAGFQEIAMVYLSLLSQFSDDEEVIWLMIDVMADLGHTELLPTILQMMPVPSGPKDEELRDAYWSAAARVALQNADTEKAKTVLGPLLDSVVSASDDPAIQAYPRAAALAIECNLVEGRLGKDFIQIALQVAARLPDWPFINRLLISLVGAGNIHQRKIGGALNIQAKLAETLPGISSLWEPLTKLLDNVEGGRARQFEAICAHIVRAPYVKRHWQLAAALTPNEKLRDAIFADLEAREPAEQTTEWATARRLRRKANALALNNVVALSDSNRGFDGNLDAPVGQEFDQWIGQWRPQDGSPLDLLVVLRSAPYNDELIRKLVQIHFFESSPWLGSLMAGDIFDAKLLRPSAASPLVQAELRLDEIQAWTYSPAQLLGNFHREATDQRLSATAYRSACSAKHAFATEPSENNTTALRYVLERFGDIEAAILLAEADELRNFAAIVPSLFILRMAGFRSATSHALTTLLALTQNTLCMFWTVETMIDLGQIEIAETIIDAYEGRFSGGAESYHWAAKAQLANRRGHAAAAERSLRQLQTAIADQEPAQIADEHPYAIFALAHSLLMQTKPLSPSLVSAMDLSFNSVMHFPYDHAVMCARDVAAASSSEAAQLVLKTALERVPAELYCAEIITELSPSTLSEDWFQNVIVAHCERHSTLRSAWTLLSKFATDSTLRSAIQADLQVMTT